jgi:glutamine amidotransferase
MIKVIDYGLGNIGAFLNVYRRMNVSAGIAKEVADLRDATKIILPGVGAFDRAVALLDASGMREALTQRVFEDKIPILGVCVGMQILARGSDEGVQGGLGWVPGHVRSFKSVHNEQNLPLPHMGWNDVAPSDGMRLFSGLEREARFYFLHSYFFQCDTEESVIATSRYGVDFSCAVQWENVYGVQFHPEKSHHYGATLLKNFAEL